MNVPSIVTPANRMTWACIIFLALGQAAALVAGVAGTRLAFASLDGGALSFAALCLIVGSAFGLSILRPSLRLMAETLGQNYTAELRKSLLRRAMSSTPEQIANRRRGYLMLRLTGDMTAFKDGLARSLPPLVQASALIPAAVLALFWMDNRFGLAGLAVVVLSLGAVALSTPRLRMLHEALRRERAKLAADMAERLPIAPELARLGRRDRELARLGKATAALRRKAQIRLAQVETLRALPGMIAGMLAVLILWDGANRTLASGEIAGALAALGILAQTLVELASAVDRMSSWRAARDKLGRALTQDGVTPRAETKTPVRLSGRALTFAIEAEEGIVSPVRLQLPPGGRARLFASDPERLVRALTLQNIDPSIKVTLNGIPLDALTLGSIRRSIAIVGNTPVVLKGSVRRNLCLGLIDRPTDVNLHRCIVKAGLAAALHSLGGMDGHIGEGGRSLSADCRIKLAALQSVAQRPAIVIVSVGRAELPTEVVAYLDGIPASVLMIEASIDNQ